jgi:hypothetical protein
MFPFWEKTVKQFVCVFLRSYQFNRRAAAARCSRSQIAVRRRQIESELPVLPVLAFKRIQNPRDEAGFNP